MTENYGQIDYLRTRESKEKVTNWEESESGGETTYAGDQWGEFLIFLFGHEPEALRAAADVKRALKSKKKKSDLSCQKSREM